MKIANIYPIDNQIMYLNEKYVMILAHLLKKGLYDKEFIGVNNQYVILDNGMFEKSMVSSDLKNIIKLVDDSGIKINEIIIPDVMYNKDATIKLFLNNYKYIKGSNYNFMIVAQHNSFKEFKEMMNFINSLPADLPLCIGIPKKSKFDRCSDKAIDMYKKAKFPIHFLGIKESFYELKKVTNVIRSCDSAQLFIAAKYGILTHKILKDMPEQLLMWKRDKSQTVDLEKDFVEYFDLRMYRKYLEYAFQ